MRSAIAKVARSLAANDPHARVFVEERVDHRISLTSSGHREITATRTHGAAIGGRHSIHLTDPDFIDSERPILGEEHENWVLGLADKIVGAAAKSAAADNSSWTAKLVSFHQEVWVGGLGLDVVRDIRQGCRLEIRVQLVGNNPSRAVEDLVLRRVGPSPIGAAFDRAFGRAEARRAIGALPQPGLTAAVFAAGSAGIVAHELIGHALEGDVVFRGQSWLRDRELPAAGREVTVTDDPRRGRGAWSIDDEGAPARDLVLVERGRRVGTLLDGRSGVAFGVASTGHGRRSSYLEAVRPRMGCTFIEAGDDDPDEVVRSSRDAVFIRRLATGHADSSTGRASFVVSDADRIIEGRIAQPLDPFLLEIEGPQAWSSIDRVAHDLTFDTCIGSCVRDGQPLAVSVGAPTIRIGVVRVCC